MEDCLQRVLHSSAQTRKGNGDHRSWGFGRRYRAADSLSGKSKKRWHPKNIWSLAKNVVDMRDAEGLVCRIMDPLSGQGGSSPPSPPDGAAPYPRLWRGRRGRSRIFLASRLVPSSNDMSTDRLRQVSVGSGQAQGRQGMALGAKNGRLKPPIRTHFKGARSWGAVGKWEGQGCRSRNSLRK